MSSRLSSEPGAGFCYFLENTLGHMGADGGTASRRCATAGFSHGQLDQLSWPLKLACLVRVRQPGWGFWTHRWVETGFGEQLTSADTLGANKKEVSCTNADSRFWDRHDSSAFMQEYTRYYSCGKEKLWADKIELNIIVLDCLSFKRAYPNLPNGQIGTAVWNRGCSWQGKMTRLICYAKKENGWRESLMF